MSLANILLRVLTHAPQTTKGSELTLAEMDQNIIEIIEAILSLQGVGNVAPYDSGTTYDSTNPTYASYDGNIYQFISLTPEIGITPGTPAAVGIWELVTIGSLTHAQNTDIYLALGTPFQMSAIQIKTIYDSLVITNTYANIVTTKGLNQLRPGYYYYISDKYILVQATTNNTFNSEGILLCRNPDHQDTLNQMLRHTDSGNYSSIWDNNTSAWWTAITVAFPVSSTRIDKLCVWQGRHFKNLTGNNGAAAPSTDTTNWEELPLSDPSYIIERQKIKFDFDDSCKILVHEDTRGNIVHAVSGVADLTNDFQFGNDQVTGNVCEGRLECYSNRGKIISNTVKVSASMNVNGNGKNGALGALIRQNTVEHGIISVPNNEGTITGNSVDDGTFNHASNTGVISYNYIWKTSWNASANQGTIDYNIFIKLTSFNVALTDPAALIRNCYFILEVPTLDLGSTNEDIYNTPILYPTQTGAAVALSSVLDIGRKKVIDYSVSGGGASTLLTITSDDQGYFVKVKPAAGNVVTILYGVGNVIGPVGESDDVFDGDSGHYFTGYMLDNEFIIETVNN